MELALARRGADVPSPKADTPPRLQILTPPAGRNTASTHRIRSDGGVRLLLDDPHLTTRKRA